VTTRRVLVTGAGGFVGANLARRLVRHGHDLMLTARPGPLGWRLEGLTADARVVRLDLRDREAVESAIREAQPEWVFHLAAFGAYSWQTDVPRIFETNATGTANVADACAAAEVEALVHAGSSSEYGFKDHAPGEDEPAEPNSAYAVAKLSGTLYCAHVARSTALRTVTLRLYSAYGPFEDPQRLIPTLVAHGLRGELPPLVEGGTARDFVYVDDVVSAFLAAAERGEPGEIYNVGSGMLTTVEELVTVARRVMEIAAEPEWGSYPARIWDTSVWVADPGKARSVLGWSADTTLEDGLRRMRDWLESSPDTAAYAK
jgi:nucleoside-diphosphate-sugar epimerase